MARFTDEDLQKVQGEHGRLTPYYRRQRAKLREIVENQSKVEVRTFTGKRFEFYHTDAESFCEQLRSGKRQIEICAGECTVIIDADRIETVVIQLKTTDGGERGRSGLGQNNG